MKVTQLCSILCDPMNYTVHGNLQGGVLEWVPFPSLRDLPNTGIEPRSPALQADSLPAEPKGKPLAYSYSDTKEYIKAVYCHPAYLTYMQSTS